MSHLKSSMIVSFFALTGLLSACGPGNNQTPTPSNTPTAMPSATLTPSPPSTPSPSNTNLPSPSVSPFASVSPSPEITNSPSAMPSEYNYPDRDQISRNDLVSDSFSWISNSLQSTKLTFRFVASKDKPEEGTYQVIAENLAGYPIYQGLFDLYYNKGRHWLILYSENKPLLCTRIRFRDNHIAGNKVSDFLTHEFYAAQSEETCKSLLIPTSTEEGTHWLKKFN